MFKGVNIYEFSELIFFKIGSIASGWLTSFILIQSNSSAKL